MSQETARIGGVTRGFFQGKLGQEPHSVEVGVRGETLLVTVKGFLSQGERAMMDQPGNRSVIEDYYLRLFDQIAPLMRAVLKESAGCRLDGVQTLLDLPRDACVFILTLRTEGETTRVEFPSKKQE